MERIILHIDFDSFFASVEQQLSPRLRGKPLGVTATNGRTCIIASSREAKQFGVKTGSRSFEAYKLCPSIILVPADFVKYFEVSKQFLHICKDYSPFVELFSIDELFMDITKTAHLFGGPGRIVFRIKQRIKEEIGEYITVSIGVSHNKLLAKLASGLDKPNGLVEITKDNIEKVYQSAKLTDICGIGERIKLRLNKCGIYTLLSLRAAPLSLLLAEFGSIEGNFLKNVGLGQDASEVIPYTQAPEVKSVGRNYCLEHNEDNKRVVLQHVYELCEEIGIKLRRLGKEAKTVGFSIRGNKNIHAVKTYPVYFDTGTELFRLFKFLFQGYSLTGVARSILDDNYVRQISVWVSNLRNKNHVPLCLFENAEKKVNLQKTIDSINKKFGDHTIRNGFLLYADKLTTVPNGWLGDRYERTKLASSSSF